jgi:hypothetical protein
MENTHRTQKLFFTSITENKLNELLKRADKKEKILQNHINSVLNPFYCDVKLVSHTIYNSSKQAIIIDYCDIIINYYDNNNLIGHMSLHIKLDNKDIFGSKKENGRLHVKNTNSTCYTLKCNKKKNPDRNNSISISILDNMFIKPKLKICTKSTLIVLNRYFDLNPEESWSLDRRLTSNPKQRHPFLYQLLYSFSKKKPNTIRKTQKNPSKF